MTMMDLNSYLPLAGGMAYGTLACIMIRRKLHKELPNFFRFVSFSALFALIAAVLCYTPYYPVMSVWLAGLPPALSFLVLYEVFVRLLRPYSAVMDMAQMLFKWAGAFLLLVAIMGACAATGNQQDKMAAAFTLIARSLMLMQCGLLMLLVLFEQRLRISWRSHSASITLGLGISAALGLIVIYLGPNLPRYGVYLDLTSGLVDIGFIGYWAVMLQQPEPQRRNVLDSPSRLIFQRWNEVLSSTPLAANGGQLAMAEVDSFIPGVEKTVERIMARKMTIN